MEAESALNSQSIIIEPFDPARRDRAAFTYGVTRVDNFLKRTARKQQAGDFTRNRVAMGTERVEILAIEEARKARR